MSAYEEILERRASDAYGSFRSARTPEGKRQHWQNLRALMYQLLAERLVRPA